MSALSIMKGAEPWGAEGDQVGVLFVHGLTGSPQGLRYWAEGVAREGRSVLVPRLPGHGTSVDDLQRRSAEEFVAEAEMSLRGLHERCHTVFACGLSMGATIVLDLAERMGDALAGIVVVNPTLYSTDPRIKLAPLLGKLPLKLKAFGNDIADPAQTELCYPKLPSIATWSVIQFQNRVKERLGGVTVPTLIFTSRQDHVVNPGNGPYALAHIGSRDKELVWLERSYHVATLDYDKDLIVERTNRFIKEHSS